MIFDNAFFSEWFLPFLLVFVVVFAVLQKSKILGDDVKQINSLVALAIGLITIVFPAPRDMMVRMMPWLGVGLGVLLIFFILYGFVAGDLSAMPKGFKIAFGILAGLFTLWIVLSVTGLGEAIYSYIGGSGQSLIINILVVLAIVGLLFLAIFSGKEGNSKNNGKSGQE